MNAPSPFRQRRSRHVAAKHQSVAQSRQAPAEPAPLEDILITQKLQSRRRRKPNSAEENTALRTLARVMVASPNELIDTLLVQALHLCSAGTAGLSVLETTPKDGQVFRWTNVAGVLSKHIGGSTPRNFSPCGTTMDRNAPQLFSYPGRRFQYFNSIDVDLVEALVLPVYLGDDMPATIWIVSHDQEVKFDSEDVRVMTGLAEFTACALRLTKASETDRLARTSLEVALEMRVEQLRDLSTRLMRLQDEERRSLARELHDSAGQFLAGVQMSLYALSKNSALVPADRSALTDALELVDRCNTEIRTMSYLLHPPLLDESGLRSALSVYAEGFANRSKIRVDLEVPEDLGRLPNDVETALFRVVQQSLLNIHRHSGSPLARIVVKPGAEGVAVEISDEGKGIPADILKGFSSGGRLAGVGIYGMRERIRDLGGQFDVQSSPNGTTIVVSLPLRERARFASTFA